MRVGRFFIYGSHHQGRAPAGTFAILLDAATAFGTGEHPSTRGCLLALQYLARRRHYRRPLDIGTGTGILAIAAAKFLHRRVAASDIDAGAVSLARRNIAVNGVAALVRAGQAAGYRDRALRGRRYDLVLSNILARPLALMAVDLARALAPGGRAVLSGLLRRQERVVLAPHRGCGIVLERRFVIDGWSTLVLRGAPVRRRSGQAALRSGRLVTAERRRVLGCRGARLAVGAPVGFENRADLRAANADIGERAVVERHQLGISPLPRAPGGKSLPGGG